MNVYQSFKIFYYILGGFESIQDSIEKIKPYSLDPYDRKCYHSGCNGTINVTKSLNNHVWIDVIFHETEINVECRLENIPRSIEIHGNK